MGKARGGRQRPCPLCPGLVSLARLQLAAAPRPLGQHGRACPRVSGWGWGAHVPSWRCCVLANRMVLTAASENVSFLSPQDFS